MEVTYKDKSYTLGKKERNVEGEAPAVRVKMLNGETLVIGLMAPAVQVMVKLNDYENDEFMGGLIKEEILA